MCAKILDVARGLEYLHTTATPAIVHADLKGVRYRSFGSAGVILICFYQNNVLITDDGVAVICDFGLSQIIEDLMRPEGLTVSNPSVGPLRWQAPELLEDESPSTQASDVWSFGCTALEVSISVHEHSTPCPECDFLG